MSNVRNHIIRGRNIKNYYWWLFVLLVSNLQILLSLQVRKLRRSLRIYCFNIHVIGKKGIRVRIRFLGFLNFFEWFWYKCLVYTIIFQVLMDRSEWLQGCDGWSKRLSNWEWLAKIKLKRCIGYYMIGVVDDR